MLKTIRPSARYTLAVTSVGAAALLRMFFSHWVASTIPFFTFYLAVAVTSYFAGFGPGLLSVALGYLATDIFFVPGVLHSDPTSVLGYLIISLTLILFGQSLQQFRRRAELFQNQARQRQRELEQETALRRQAEASLRASQSKIKCGAGDFNKELADRTAALTATIRSLEGFCYSVSHDLRAPIRAMQGYASVLAEDCTLGTAARDYTHRISRAAVRMDQLVSDLLVYGRLAHEPMECGPVHLEAVVDHVLAELADEIDSRKAVVKVIRPLPQAMGHSPVIEQSLANLLRNAMKFVENGATPRVNIRGETLSDTVRLCVEDNGIGIASRYHEQIFNIFERAHTVDDYSGIGLGLAIVKKGVERMGGTVGVNSEPGVGSTFWIELPRLAAVQLPPLHPELNL